MHGSKSDVWSNDTVFNASNKYLLAIDGTAIYYLIDDDNRWGDIDIM